MSTNIDRRPGGGETPLPTSAIASAAHARTNTTNTNARNADGARSVASHVESSLATRTMFLNGEADASDRRPNAGTPAARLRASHSIRTLGPAHAINQARTTALLRRRH